MANTPPAGDQSTDFLIIGAGPFGLAAAAQAQSANIDHRVVGEPMGFWRHHMPQGMVLRSTRRWNLDPTRATALDSYLDEHAPPGPATGPISLSSYLEYADWFRTCRGIEPLPGLVARLDGGDRLVATLDDGQRITARHVLLAIGFECFAYVPPELASLLPEGAYLHTSAVDRPDRFRGKRVLLIGGRQSAFETSALMAEAGAAAVHLCYRHDTPRFAPSNWDWIEPLVQRFEAEPGWYGALPEAERAELGRRFWAEGRLKVEPWLGPRITTHPAICLHPNSQVSATAAHADGLRATLDNGVQLDVDRVVFATGYRVDLQRVPMLARGNLLGLIKSRDGSPVLDESLQTSVPGLFMTSLAAARDFGPFFAFTAAAAVSARIVVRALGA